MCDDCYRGLSSRIRVCRKIKVHSANKCQSHISQIFLKKLRLAVNSQSELVDKAEYYHSKINDTSNKLLRTCKKALSYPLPGCYFYTLNNFIKESDICGVFSFLRLKKINKIHSKLNLRASHCRWKQPNFVKGFLSSIFNYHCWHVSYILSSLRNHGSEN